MFDVYCVQPVSLKRSLSNAPRVRTLNTAGSTVFGCGKFNARPRNKNLDFFLNKGYYHPHHPRHLRRRHNHRYHHLPIYLFIYRQMKDRQESESVDTQLDVVVQHTIHGGTSAAMAS